MERFRSERLKQISKRNRFDIDQSTEILTHRGNALSTIASSLQHEDDESDNDDVDVFGSDPNSFALSKRDVRSSSYTHFFF